MYYMVGQPSEWPLCHTAAATGQMSGQKQLILSGSLRICSHNEFSLRIGRVLRAQKAPITPRNTPP